MIKRRTETTPEISMEEALESQLDNVGGEPEVETPKTGAAQYLGQQLTHSVGRAPEFDKESINSFVEEKKLSRVGEKIGQNAEIRDGWMAVDRALLRDRGVFYPSDWVFKIQPATVEAIRNWATVDENNPNSLDEVFDEILKSCLRIQTNTGAKPWYCINAWDRFFFILLIREYSMKNGQKSIEFTKSCPNCDVDVKFKLDALSLMYDMPDPEVMGYYDEDNQTWNIVPSDFGVEWPGTEYLQLYLPTREKDANIKAWLISKLQEDRNYKADQVFIKFLPWMLPKIAKDVNISKSQIRKAEIEFKSWGIEQFTFMDDVIRNIVITPGTNLLATCTSCGEEVTAPMQFPDGIGSLFDMVDRRTRFGKK